MDIEAIKLFMSQNTDTGTDFVEMMFKQAWVKLSQSEKKMLNCKGALSSRRKSWQQNDATKLGVEPRLLNLEYYSSRKKLRIIGLKESLSELSK